MIRKIAKEFWICYDADGSQFDGPFASLDEAQTRADSLKPVDRMLVSCKGPQLKTDVEFLKGHCNGNQFERNPEIGDELRAAAEHAGVDTKGKVRIGQLCRPGMPDDPLAWVGGRGDVQRRLEAINASCDGIVNAKGRAPEGPPKPSIKLNDDIVQEKVAEALEGQTVTKTQYLDKCEEVRNTHSPKYEF